METKKDLLVISNHNPEIWDEKQKEGWDYIEYYPFPNVPAAADGKEVINLSIPICEQIGKFYADCESVGSEGFITIQGEFSLCKAVFDALHGEDDVRFIFPTTERVVVEETQPDGSVKKITQFKFVKWREV